MTTEPFDWLAAISAPLKPEDPVGEVFEAFLEQAAGALKTLTWPSARYRKDPNAFAIEVLGEAPWARQSEVLEAIADHPRVAVKSGHKVGKSRIAVVAALWFFCSFEDARVVFSSSSNRQVDGILWRELRKVHARCKIPIGGDLHELARSGLKASDFREIVGYTAKDPEKMAGTSGANLLYVLDEASGIPDPIFEAIEGNRAGGARVLMFSNPTRTSGEFFDAFNGKREFYRTISISSTETPNVVEGRIVVPGLATREWIEEKKQEWGEDNPLYQVRVAGNFPKQDACAVVPLFLVEEAVERWADTDASGPLELGVDVARFGDDDSVIVPRRGAKALDVVSKNGFDEVELCGLVLETVRKLRNPHEKARVKIDTCGGYGAALAGRLRDHKDLVEVVEVNVAEKSDAPNEYHRLRDQLWFAIADWMKAGGAIPENGKLEAELVAPAYRFEANGSRRVESKDEIKKKIKRSPDRADALALAVFNKDTGHIIRPKNTAANARWSGSPDRGF